MTRMTEERLAEIRSFEDGEDAVATDELLAEVDALRGELAKAEKWIALTNPLHGYNVKLKARAEAAEARVVKWRPVMEATLKHLNRVNDNDGSDWGDAEAAECGDALEALLEETKP